jgi:hypothetical protein
MIFILERLLLLIVFVLFCTEIFYPILFDKSLFVSFRKVSKKENKPDLSNKLLEAKAKIEEIKKVQEEVNEFHKTAEDLKSSSDNLFKN